MALGGGTFLVQNKILPGAYLNFVSVAQASATLSERGVATLPLALDWGPENQMFTVELEEFLKDSQRIFGYAYTAEELRPLREVFKHAKTLHCFRLNLGGKKAANTLATAKYPGSRGNALRLVITENENSTDDAPLFDVATYLEAAQVDKQLAIGAMSDLQPNPYLDWLPEAELTLTAGAPLTGGENGQVLDAAYQTYLDQAENYTYNAMGCLAADKLVKELFVAYNKRMRDEVGKKCQLALFNQLADYEGVVSVKNGLADDKESPALAAWVTGVLAGTVVNKSATNMTYDGEYAIDTEYTQKQLEKGLQEGSWLFHQVDGKVTVLRDINTFVSVTPEKSADFASNQTIRVLDQVANDIALLFGQKYIGKVPNDAAGRISLWNDIVKHHQELQAIRAIEGFAPENVRVAPGNSKKAVLVEDYITPVNAMEQLYMTVYVE